MVAQAIPEKNVSELNKILVHCDTTYEKDVLRLHFCLVPDTSLCRENNSYWTLSDIRRNRGEIYSFYGKRNLNDFIEMSLQTGNLSAVEFILYNKYTLAVKERLSVVRYSSLSAWSLRLKEYGARHTIMLTHKSKEEVEMSKT